MNTSKLPTPALETSSASPAISTTSALDTILGHAYSLVAISKTINQLACEEPVRETSALMLDSGDMVALSSLAQTLAQFIVDLAQAAEAQA